MSAHQPYATTNRARSPGKLFALAVFASMLALGVVEDAPWYFFAPVLLGGLLLCWAILVGGDRHFSLDDSTMRWGSAKAETVVPLAEIDRVVIKEWSDSTDVLVHRRDGAQLQVPATAAPETTGAAGARFVAALEDRQIPVERG